MAKKEPVEPDDIQMPSLNIPNIPGLESFQPLLLPPLNWNRGMGGLIWDNWKLRRLEKNSAMRANIEGNNLKAMTARIDQQIAINTFASKQYLAFKRLDHENRMLILEETKITEEVKKLVYENQQALNEAKLSGLDYRIREKASKEVLGEPAENRVE